MHITKNQYLEKIARIVSGTNLIVKAEGQKSGVDLGSKPITITISEDTKWQPEIRRPPILMLRQSQKS